MKAQLYLYNKFGETIKPSKPCKSTVVIQRKIWKNICLKKLLPKNSLQKFMTQILSLLRIFRKNQKKLRKLIAQKTFWSTIAVITSTIISIIGQTLKMNFRIMINKMKICLMKILCSFISTPKTWNQTRRNRSKFLDNSNKWLKEKRKTKKIRKSNHSSSSSNSNSNIYSSSSSKNHNHHSSSRSSHHSNNHSKNNLQNQNVATGKCQVPRTHHKTKLPKSQLLS